MKKKTAISGRGKETELKEPPASAGTFLQISLEFSAFHLDLSRRSVIMIRKISKNSVGGDFLRPTHANTREEGAFIMAEEKKIPEEKAVQELTDEQLDQVSGGSRIICGVDLNLCDQTDKDKI